MVPSQPIDAAPGGSIPIDCATDPTGSLIQMFVNQVEVGRIAKGQSPALRPVFLKPHGVAAGTFRINADLPPELKVGVFAGSEYPCWVRFSSDTSPTSTDYQSTCGIGIKLFDVPGKKILGLPDDVTFDFILQNFPVFFVDTARDMCEFTRAGVVGGDYQPYLDKHPETARLLDEMTKPVGSVLGIDYWSGVPFAFGPGKFVKYKLEPTKPIAPPTRPPDNPSYLGMEMTQSLQSGETRFRFYVQFQTNPLTMPLDQATVDWSEAESPPVWIAELILPQQDVTVRGQANYGENLSYNVWRVTEPHTPQGSLAEARRDVYAASAKLRRDVNGIPAGEPEYPKPVIQPAPPIDSVIVRAAIHPAIGIARVGDSVDGYYIGPEVTNPTSLPPGSYRDATGALKRQAARFRIYGYNAAGEVVAALNSNSAHIQWTVHLANRKSQWYQFQAAMDVPEAVDLTVPLRNKDVAPADRDSLAIDPGPRSISGSNSAGGNQYFFNTGTFKGVVVPLGEIRTDDHGNLLVLGGKGVSASPNGAPVYIESDPDSFNNANDWYDDISDGPVMATVTINDRQIPVESAWVSVAPPNYAPDIIGWRTLYECLVDVYTQNGWLPLPSTVSFTHDILPLLSRLNNLQWVNKGFAALYGGGCPLDFSNPELIAKLAQTPVGLADPYKELRRVLKNSFRPYNTPSNATGLWPWIYGDTYGSFQPNSPGKNLDLPAVQQTLLQRWVDGDFINDWSADYQPPQMLSQVPTAQQPAMLDKAALHFCLADAFHPGCELTWPMRHASMYTKPFRIRQRASSQKERVYGPNLTQPIVLEPGGPLYDQGPGDLTRWMAIPWQGDTGFCRSGYESAYDPYLPTFWPARVPNQVLTEDSYQIVMDTSRPRDERIAAYNTRLFWTRSLPGDAVAAMMDMVANFQDMGIVEARPGIKGDPDFPEVIYVESLAAARLNLLANTAKMLAAAPASAPPLPQTSAQAELHEAGWESESHREEWLRIRVRHRK